MSQRNRVIDGLWAPDCWSCVSSSSVTDLKRVSKFMQKGTATLCRSVLFFIISTCALSAEGETAMVKKTRKNALNVQLAELFFKSYFINYEHMVASRHGVVVEGGYIGPYTFSLNLSGKAAKWQASQGYTFGAQYRLHFWESMDSAFIGAFYKYGSLAGTILSSDGSGVLFTSTNGQPPIGFVSVYHIIGVQLGMRIVWDSGFNLAGRVGAGVNLGSLRYSTQDFETNRNAFATVFATVLGFDMEISAGYAF